MQDTLIKIEHGTEQCSRMLLPTKDALDVLSGKWKLQILIALMFGKKRFSQIQAEVIGITPKMLSKELKQLEINELAVRHVYDTAPVSVEYEMTVHGKTLEPLLRALTEWGIVHRKRVIASSKKQKKNSLL